MIKEIVDVRVLDGYRLFLRFEDGMQGEVDVAKLVKFEGVFAPLKEWEFFAKARLDPELGTVVWPNGADLDPPVLYSQVSGKPLPEFRMKTLS